MKTKIVVLTLASFLTLSGLGRSSDLTVQKPASHPAPSGVMSTAKLDLRTNRSVKVEGLAAAKVIVSPSPNLITPAEWQKLRVARMAAIKDNPALLASARELSARMHEFQTELDAAMIKNNPNVASIVFKIENGRPGPRATRFPEKVGARPPGAG
jgi:hypothetical protein